MDKHLKISGSITALGIVTAIVTAILYFMRLPIFDEVDLAWTFFIGLIAAAVAVLSFIMRAIWFDK